MNALPPSTIIKLKIWLREEITKERKNEEKNIKMNSL